MDKKTVLLTSLTIILVIGVVILITNLSQQKPVLSNPLADQSTTTVEIVASDTTIEYSDPSGFSFSYPDNLSLTNNESEDPNTYADIILTAKGVTGDLDLKISDTKFASLDNWIEGNDLSSQTPKEVKLGDLKALEIKTNNRLLLGALDQGVLFTIEISFAEKPDFWMKVYNTVLSNFTFAPPSQDTVATQGGSNTSSEEVIFEGEEVVE